MIFSDRLPGSIISCYLRKELRVAPLVLGGSGRGGVYFSEKRLCVAHALPDRRSSTEFLTLAGVGAPGETVGGSDPIAGEKSLGSESSRVQTYSVGDDLVA